MLTDVKDATFILTGVFTPEGSGLAVAFTRGPQGWGRIVRTDDAKLEVSTLAPSQSSGPQTSFHGPALSQDYLQINECPEQVIVADCGGSGTIETSWWYWTGKAFILS